jgi:hypothetical protein
MKSVLAFFSLFGQRKVEYQMRKGRNTRYCPSPRPTKWLDIKELVFGSEKPIVAPNPAGFKPFGVGQRLEQN